MFSAYLNCDDCLGKGQLTSNERASWHCGRMDESAWTGDGFPAPPQWPVKAEECPGRLITLSQVIETVRAVRFFDKGMLPQRYGGDAGLTDLLLDAIEVFQSECSVVEEAMLSEVN